MASPFYYVFKVVKRKTIAIFLITIFVFVYSFNNLMSFKRQVKDEAQNNDLALSELIIKNFPNRKIYVASFPGYVFEKVFYFLDKPPRRKISTDYHINFLNNFNRQEKYFYIIIFPEAFNKQFEEADPAGKIIRYSDQYSLFIN